MRSSMTASPNGAAPPSAIAEAARKRALAGGELHGILIGADSAVLDRVSPQPLGRNRDLICYGLRFPEGPADCGQNPNPASPTRRRGTSVTDWRGDGHQPAIGTNAGNDLLRRSQPAASTALCPPTSFGNSGSI